MFLKHATMIWNWQGKNCCSLHRPYGRWSAI